MHGGSAYSSPDQDGYNSGGSYKAPSPIASGDGSSEYKSGVHNPTANSGGHHAPTYSPVSMKSKGKSSSKSKGKKSTGKSKGKGKKGKKGKNTYSDSGDNEAAHPIEASLGRDGKFTFMFRRSCPREHHLLWFSS
jgi:hypothetical protein